MILLHPFIGQQEVDDDAVAGRAFAVNGFMEQIGRDQHNISKGHVIQVPFKKMLPFRREKDHDLVKGMEMLELHIYGGAAIVIIEIVQQLLLHIVDDDVMLFFKNKGIIYNHIH